MTCWTYSAVGCLEGVYQIRTGSLKEFAGQELMDCVYEGTGHSGSYGGISWDAYDWMKKHQRIAPKSEYLSTGQDGKCDNQGKTNALVGFRVTGYKYHPTNEAGLVQGNKKIQGNKNLLFFTQCYKYKIKIT